MILNLMDQAMNSQTFWERNQGRKAQKEIALVASWLGADKLAVQILYNMYYNLDVEDPVWPEKPVVPPTGDEVYAEHAKLIADPVEMTHDDIHQALQRVLTVTDRRKVVDAFIAGIMRDRNDLKSPLASYAQFLHHPQHEHVMDAHTESYGWCVHCMLRQVVTLDRNSINLIRYRNPSGGADYAMVDLEEFAKYDPVELLSDERDNFAGLLDAIRDLPAKARTSQLVKAATRFIPGGKWRRVAVMETLGCCGILKPSAITWSPDTYFWGPASEQIQSLGIRTNREWQAPASGWCGADGVNEEAVDFWFPGFAAVTRPTELTVV